MTKMKIDKKKSLITFLTNTILIGVKLRQNSQKVSFYLKCKDHKVPTNTMENLGVAPTVTVDDNDGDVGETDNTDVVDNNTNNKQHVNIFRYNSDLRLFFFKFNILKLIFQFWLF